MTATTAKTKTMDSGDDDGDVDDAIDIQPLEIDKSGYLPAILNAFLRKYIAIFAGGGLTPPQTTPESHFADTATAGPYACGPAVAVSAKRLSGGGDGGPQRIIPAKLRR